MKKVFFVILSLGVFTLATSFTHYSNRQNIPSGVYKIMEVTQLWDLMHQDYKPDYYKDYTWLDVGFRAKYAMAKKYASIEMVEKAFGQKVFLKGPHGKDMNFKSTTSFGHYNPAFISEVHQSLEVAFQNPVFKSVAKQIFGMYLDDMARNYNNAYLYWDNNSQDLENTKRDYLAAMAQPGGTTDGTMQMKFWGGYPERDTNADIFEASSAPAFWVRRSIDGTSDSIIELLNFVREELD